MKFNKFAFHFSFVVRIVVVVVVAIHPLTSVSVCIVWLVSSVIFFHSSCQAPKDTICFIWLFNFSNVSVVKHFCLTCIQQLLWLAHTTHSENGIPIESIICFTKPLSTIPFRITQIVIGWYYNIIYPNKTIYNIWINFRSIIKFYSKSMFEWKINITVLWSFSTILSIELDLFKTHLSLTERKGRKKNHHRHFDEVFINPLWFGNNFQFVSICDNLFLEYQWKLSSRWNRRTSWTGWIWAFVINVNISA